MVSTSIVGAYVTVVAFDRFVDGSLSFIILNVVKRAVVPSMVMNAVPFQNKGIPLRTITNTLTIVSLIRHNIIGIMDSTITDGNSVATVRRSGPDSCSIPGQFHLLSAPNTLYYTPCGIRYYHPRPGCDHKTEESALESHTNSC